MGPCRRRGPAFSQMGVRHVGWHQTRAFWGPLVGSSRAMNHREVPTPVGPTPAMAEGPAAAGIGVEQSAPSPVEATARLLERSFRQAVPRPPGARPGAAPRWAGAGARARVGVGLDRIEGALRQVEVAAQHQRSAQAAVLLALFEEEGEALAVLIRRAPALAQDPGHLALPGGHIEPGEPPLAAALREAEEEIGLDPALVTLLGVLPPVLRARSSESVLAFVGALERRPALVLNPDEVDAVLEVRLCDLLADGVAWQERWPRVEERSVCFFATPQLGDDLLWGVTARIFWSLLEAVVAAYAGPREA